MLPTLLEVTLTPSYASLPVASPLIFFWGGDAPGEDADQLVKRMLNDQLVYTKRPTVRRTPSNHEGADQSEGNRMTGRTAPEQPERHRVTRDVPKEGGTD